MYSVPNYTQKYYVRFVNIPPRRLFQNYKITRDVGGEEITNSKNQCTIHFPLRHILGHSAGTLRPHRKLRLKIPQLAAAMVITTQQKLHFFRCPAEWPNLIPKQCGFLFC